MTAVTGGQTSRRLTPAGAAAAPDQDRLEMRRVLGRFATGVTVVTTGREAPRGMTANSFTSVSLDPPLVLVCVSRDTATHEAIQADGCFAISVLGAGQERHARWFADRDRPRGTAEFDPFQWRPGPKTGVPVLTDVLAWLECRLDGVYEAGDHSIFLGEVLTIARGDADSALLFFGGGFHRLEPARP